MVPEQEKKPTETADFNPFREAMNFADCPLVYSFSASVLTLPASASVTSLQPLHTHTPQYVHRKHQFALTESYKYANED